jgi:hypothetical protein
LVNLSALGFLGSLGFLGYTTPQLHGFFGFFGLYGLFGLIGLGFMVEFWQRQPKSTDTSSPASAPGVQKPDRFWRRLVLSLILVPLGLLLAAVIAYQSAQAPASQSNRPEIESVEVSGDQAVIHGRDAGPGSAIPGLYILVGTNSDFWLDHHIHDPYTVTLSTYPRNKFTYTVKHYFGPVSYNEGDHGMVKGQIVLRKGKLSAEPDGSYVIGEFQPDGGTPLPITVKLEVTKLARPLAAAASGTAFTYKTSLVTRGELSFVIGAEGRLNPVVSNPEKWQIAALVPESDIAVVEAGQYARFTMDALPGRSFTGRVLQVSNAPITMQNGDTYYGVAVEANDADPKFRPGMAANLALIVAHREEVLRVPNAALRFRMPESPSDPSRGPRTAPGGPQGGHTVWVLRDNQNREPTPEPVSIRTGISDGTFTEVTAGLKEGDRVITAWVSPPGGQVIQGVKPQL